MNNENGSGNNFYEHEKFGKVPIGWDVIKLGDFFDFFPTASYSRALLSDIGDCGYIHYGDIHTRFDRFIDVNSTVLPCISKDMAKKYTQIADGDLIISDASEDYEGVGKSVEVINVGEKVIISGLHTLHLRVKDNQFITGFKGYILNQEKVRNNILRIATGIKVYSVSKTELKKILLPKPPKPEQTAIASILSKVDEAIEATQNSIKAAEKLKKALMQNLLTGKLKPDGTWRTEDEYYMDEKFGKVPVGWEITKIKKIVKLKNGKGNTTSNLKEKPIDDYEIPVYGGNGITGYYNIPLLSESTLIIGRVGEYCGNVFKTPKLSWVTDNAMLVDKFLIEDYSLDFFKYKFSTLNFKNFSDSTGQPKITQGGIGAIYLIYPKLKNDQVDIAIKISKVNNISVNKQSKIQALHRLKKSLMQNLLTGKIRVDVAKINELLKEQENE